MGSKVPSSATSERLRLDLYQKLCNGRGSLKLSQVETGGPRAAFNPTGPYCLICRVFFKFTFEFVYWVCCLEFAMGCSTLCGLTMGGGHGAEVLGLLRHIPLQSLSWSEPLMVQKMTIVIIAVMAGYIELFYVSDPFLSLFI